jgi:hypothetical protein
MSRSIVAGCLLALLVAACQSPVVPTGTPVVPTATPTATTAAQGMLHLTSDGRYDQFPIRLAYVVGGVRIEGETIDSDIEVIVNRPFPPGSVEVLFSDRACDGSVLIASNMETDALLDFGAEACSISTTDTHPAGSVKHRELPTTASVGALLPFGVPSVFLVRSLDTPGAAPAAEVAVDEAPWEAAQVVVQPGRYEVSVLVDDAVLARDVLDLERGEDRIVNLRVLPPSIPRDCGDTEIARCELAITAGYAGGLSIEGNTIASAVRVRPTRYRVCDMVLTPEFDVTFTLANPAGEIEVTVGSYPDGRLGACTY